MSRFFTVAVTLVALALCVSACAPPANRNDSAEDQILEERAREYFDQRFLFYPVEATVAGLHAYDDELGQFGAGQITSRILELRDLRQRLLGIDLTRLSRDSFVDALWLTSAIKAELFELGENEQWRRSPLFYSDVLCRGVTSLIEPWSSPRTEALVSRLNKVQTFLDTATENLENPSPLGIEQGVSDLRACQATIGELPEVLADFLNDQQATQVRRAVSEAQEHIQEFVSYLENEIAPGGPESFRWGEEKLRLQLLYQEMEETPLPIIRLLAERRLSDTKEKTRSLLSTLEASELSSAEPERPPPVVGDDTSADLASATEEMLERLQALVSSQVADFVADAPIPPVQVSRFVSPDAVARLEAPGPLDPSGEAVFLVASPPEPPPDPAVPFELQALALREVYPGKYFRILAGRAQMPLSDLRRLVVSGANREGWSQYAETVLLDEAYADADPQLRLAVLRRSLLEQTRLVTAILLHADDLSLATAASMFVNEALVDPETADREARMVAVDPSRMSAALGKLQIMKLRRDFLAEDDAATLEDFHRAFLSCGELPLRLVRLLLLSDGEGGTLED